MIGPALKICMCVFFLVTMRQIVAAPPNLDGCTPYTICVEQKKHGWFGFGGQGLVIIQTPVA